MPDKLGNHAFLTYGFPQPDQALSGSGTITGFAALNGIQYLQLESSQVTPGFSGAPVFDEVTQRVVESVYADVPHVLWPAAALSVRAQLEYLGRG